MSNKQIYRELVTINGKNVVLAHNEPPVINAGVLENADIFRMINIFAEHFSPSNIDKADGTPLRLYTSDKVKIDVSKRRKHDMGFWHRNVDAHEIIFCVKGALKWETEMGVKIMHPGDMLVIPKGIGHRSMLCEDSTDENVLIDGIAVRGCLTLAVQAEGRAVTTVESLASPDGNLNALQLAFQQHHALQCGFCTPGILMSFTDYLARNPHPTEDEIREVLSGHLCRCTGYAGIVAAVFAASGGAAEPESRSRT